MKSSTLPPLRVSPELRADAEAVLAPGEALSSFVHDAVTRTIEYRKARRTRRYVSSSAAPRTLRRQLSRGRATGLCCARS